MSKFMALEKDTEFSLKCSDLLSDDSVNKSPRGREGKSCLPWPTSWSSIPRGGGWVLFLSHIPSQSPGRQLHPYHHSGEKKRTGETMYTSKLSHFYLKQLTPTVGNISKYPFKLLLSFFCLSHLYSTYPAPVEGTSSACSMTWSLVTSSCIYLQDSFVCNFKPVWLLEWEVPGPWNTILTYEQWTQTKNTNRIRI